MKTVVTAGEKGADIDVFACAIAYAELLILRGIHATPVVGGTFTASVTPSVLAWGAPFETTYTPTGSEHYVLVDISDPQHFAPFIDHNRISEVYDHRYGFETYWQEKLGSDSHVEMVGACATLIWEQYKKWNQESAISSHAARLLFAAIVSNNLALKSELFTERDQQAYEELKAITQLSEDWVAAYYEEQEAILYANFSTYVDTDTKQISTPQGDFIIGQIEVWNDNLLERKGTELERLMLQHEPIPWMVNIINVAKGYNQIFSTNPTAQKIIENTFGLPFTNNVATTNKLLMRKYLMKRLQS
jgi:inorganic pyrophosphatase/manganese-dependent inorganic pyrophosphatase